MLTLRAWGGRGGGAPSRNFRRTSLKKINVYPRLAQRKVLMIYAAAARDVVAHISCVYCNQCTNYWFWYKIVRFLRYAEM